MYNKTKKFLWTLGACCYFLPEVLCGTVKLALLSFFLLPLHLAISLKQNKEINNVNFVFSFSSELYISYFFLTSYSCLIKNEKFFYV